MKRFIIALLAFAFLSAHAEPENLNFVRGRLVAYHDSGQYAMEVASQLQKAQDYLVKRIAEPHKNKLAIVLDIDETSLSNYESMKKLNFGGSKEDIDHDIELGNDTIIQPTLDLFNLAEKNKVAVFFITGRAEHERAITEKNLKQAGYNQWQGLTLRPEIYHETSIVPYKSSARAALIQKGYDIILNIGDQWSDLKGGNADKSIKLPNPYYYLP
jgi:predicted secreted acid phosphatase